MQPSKSLEKNITGSNQLNTAASRLEQKLAAFGIHGPGSKQLTQYEAHLSRYFEREYERLEKNPVSLNSLQISTSSGPMSEATDKLMDQHYDEDMTFFSSFLDKKYKAYTMAYYGEGPEEVMSSTLDIEGAQHNKFRLISERAEIKGNERILNIGCGFAPLEVYLLEKYPNIKITGITPSKTQTTYIRDMMADQNHPLSSNNFTLVEGAFDELSTSDIGSSQFDLVITIGLFEHVINMKYVINRINKLLLPNGRSFHHFITSKLPIPQFLDPNETRIGLYFPGGRAWPQDELSSHDDELELCNYWFVNGMNYWRTLDEWHRRFWNHLPDIYGRVFDADAIAHWNNYFSLCKAVFTPMNGAFYGNSHYLFRKRN